MKRTIKLTESELHKIIKESIDQILVNENGFTDSMKGAWKGLNQGYNELAGNEGNLHQTSSIISQACDYFSKIHKALSKNDVQGAMQICSQAYKECKGDFNKTALNGNTITPQYGAYNPNNFGKK